MQTGRDACIPDRRVWSTEPGPMLGPRRSPGFGRCGVALAIEGVARRGACRSELLRVEVDVSPRSLRLVFSFSARIVARSGTLADCLGFTWKLSMRSRSDASDCI